MKMFVISTAVDRKNYIKSLIPYCNFNLCKVLDFVWVLFGTHRFLKSGKYIYYVCLKLVPC